MAASQSRHSAPAKPMGLRNTFIAIVAVCAIGTGAWLSYELAVPPATPKTATVLPAPAALSEFVLLDQDGEPVSPDTFRGQWDLVFFGFTNCPDVCPLTLQVLASARRELQAAGQEPLPRIVLVSVDPERDSPDIMKAYVSSFGEDILGVTGDVEELLKFTKSLGIFFAKSFIDDSNYTMDHSAVVLAVNPQGEFHALFGAPHEIDNFVHDLPLIMTSQ